MFEPNGCIFIWNSRQQTTFKKKKNKTHNLLGYGTMLIANSIQMLQRKQLLQPSRNPLFLDNPVDGYDYSKTMASIYQ